MDLSKIGETSVIPVGIFDTSYQALKVAEILKKNSINVLEVTIRTDAALSIIKTLKNEFPEMYVGAGSILSVENLKASRDNGAEFFVAPCLDIEVAKYAKKNSLDFVPGIATPSELNYALSDFSTIKVFPVESLGGVNYLNSIIAPFKMKDFNLVPTGGVNLNNFKKYIDQEKVLACGMSNIIDKKLIEVENYKEIENRLVQLREVLGL